MTEAVRPEPSRLYRWIVLILISIAMGGDYYIYDSINPLERIFIEHLGYSGTLFGWLNAAYSVAAVLTLLIGGIIIDRIGTKKSIFIFSVLCFLGALLTAARGNFATMVAGRTVLGLGAESLIVAVTTALAKWFRGKELSFAFGVNLTIARLASVAADNSPTWAKSVFYPQGPSGQPSWQGPLLIAVAAGVLSMICSIAYWYLENRAEGRYQLGKAGSIDKLEFKGILKFNPSYWYVVGLCFTFLFCDLSLPNICDRLLHEQDTGVSRWGDGLRDCADARITKGGRLEQPASAIGDDRDTLVWIAGR